MPYGGAAAGGVVESSSQILALAGVAVGAVVSFVATSLNERFRFAREQASWWRQKRLEAYIEFFEAADKEINVARRIVSGGSVGATGQPLTGEESRELLAQCESARAESANRLALLGDSATLQAIRGLTKEIWRIEWIARDLLSPTEDQWLSCIASYTQALNLAQSCIRSELGVPGVFLPRRGFASPYVPELPPRVDG